MTAARTLAGRVRAVFEPAAVLDRPARMLRRAQGLLGPNPLQTLERVASYARHRRDYLRLKANLVDFRAVLALLLARRVGLLEALERSTLTPESAAMRCGITPGGAATLLNMLETQGAVMHAADGYSMTPFARAFLTDESTLTLAPLLDLLAGFAGAIDELTSALRSGRPCPSLDVLTEEAADALLDAVNSYLDFAGRELLARIDLPPIRSFIAGSMGVSFSGLVLSRERESAVTYGCLPHLVARIPRLRERYRIDPVRVRGMHAHSGEPEDDRWGSEDFDLVFLTKKMILAPEVRLGERFARKAFEVLRPGGVAVLWEAVHPDRTSGGRSLAAESLLDLGVSPAAGPLRMGNMERMLRNIGFARTERVACLGGETTFLVARRGA